MALTGQPIAARPAPGPRGLPLLGSLRALRNDPLALFARGAASGADLVAYRAAHLRVFLVVGGDAIARVEIANRDNYVKGKSYDALRIPIGDALLTADGETRRVRRRALLPIFSRRAVLERLPAVEGAVGRLSRRWEERAATGLPVDLRSEMNALAFDVAGRTLVGTGIADEMRQLEPLIEEASDWVARRTRALVPLPHRIPTPANLRYWRAERIIRRFAVELIERRRADGADGNDLLGRMIALSDSSSDALRDWSLRDELIGLLMAGHQTTGAALAWAWYLVARHPEVDERIAKEAVGVLGNGSLDADSLESLVYTRQVLDETMRMYPPGWAFTRTALAPDELAGYEIPAGAILVVSPYANQRSPRTWSKPERFDPGRFAHGEAAPDPYAYFPFGVGPNACIGKHLALVEATAALAVLAARFRADLEARAPVRPVPGITLTPGGPILARMRLRRG